MSPNDVTVRFYRQGDERGMLCVLQDAFRRWPRVDLAVDPIDHLRWKLRSHEDALLTHAVAESGGRIVGLWLTLAQRVKLRDRQALVRQGIDVAVDPLFRTSGIAARLQQLRRTRIDVFDFHLSVPSGHPAIQRLGVPLERIMAGNELQVLVHSLGGPPPGVAHARCAIRQVRHVDERIDHFWQEASRPFDLIVERRQAYLNWRYGDPCAGRFTTKLAEEHGAIVGYATLCLARDRGYIADLLALPDRLDVVEALVGEALADLCGGVAQVECWLPAHHPYREVLQQRGFVNLGARQVWCGPLRAPASDLEFLLDPKAAVHLTIGDTDLV